MQIIEIYKSLQGESSYAGAPCVFVRTAGCNLRCTWCDSEYTFKGGQKMTVDQIQQEVRQLSPDGGLVEITGGEPMLQETDLVYLMDRLLAARYTVLLETSGERLLDKVPKPVVKIVDVKCPHSGEGGTFRIENLEHLGPRDEVKFVLASRTDYEFARAFIREHELTRKVASVILSPAFRKDATGARDVSHCLIDPQRTGRVDFGRWAQRAIGVTDSQVYLGTIDEGRVTHMNEPTRGKKLMRSSSSAVAWTRLSALCSPSATSARRMSPLCISTMASEPKSASGGPSRRFANGWAFALGWPSRRSFSGRSAAPH